MKRGHAFYLNYECLPASLELAFGDRLLQPPRRADEFTEAQREEMLCLEGQHT